MRAQFAFILPQTPICQNMRTRPIVTSAHTLYRNLLYLLNSQHPGALPLSGSLLLVALVESNGAPVITAKVVKVLDLVNPNDPVLASKSLLNGAKLRTLGGKSYATNAVLGLSSGEQRVVVVVRHLVPILAVSGH